MGLALDDKEFVDCISESYEFAFGYSLHKLFVIMLLSESMTYPYNVFQETWKYLSDGIIYEKRRLLNQPDLIIEDDVLRKIVLFEIQKLLLKHGKLLSQYTGMASEDCSGYEQFENVLIMNELSYCKEEMLREHGILFPKMNREQRIIYDEVTQAVNVGCGGLFFIYGHGGTGKTFLWNVLSSRFRSEGKIVLNVASSGIASLLLPGGKTAHSQFCIPLLLNEDSTCVIKQGSMKAGLIKEASIIIWDEAPMVNKWAFEALDRTLRDIMRFKDGGRFHNIPFGGKVVVLGGDFRQVLPIVPKGNRADIVMATITSSYLWRDCKVLYLNKNMRLSADKTPEEIEELKEFSQWVLSIGNGHIGVEENGEFEVQIPSEYLIQESSNYIESIIQFTYPDIVRNIENPLFLQHRAILTPNLDIVEQINLHVLSMFPHDSVEYLSADSICKVDKECRMEADWFTTEFINDIKCSGLPNHKLVLKAGVPVMLLRNIDHSSGLCNGTRLIVTRLGKNVLGAKVLTGKVTGEEVFIPRMTLTPSDSSLPFKFQRRQFPLTLCFAMTINKSQGQTLSHVGLYLPKPVFGHGQLYVAISRVTSRCGLKILIVDSDGRLSNKTKNVVFKEVYQKI